jgi:hypothetical protein
MLFLSPHEIADHLMLYRLAPAAITEICKCTLDDILLLSNTDIGQMIRSMYELWNPSNPYTAGSYDPNVYNTVDDNPKHPHNVTKQVLTIVWNRVQ